LRSRGVSGFIRLEALIVVDSILLEILSLIVRRTEGVVRLEISGRHVNPG